MQPLDETQIIGSPSLSVPFSQRTRATAVCFTTQPIISPRTAAGWMGRLNAKSDTVASRVILLEIIWSGVSGSHRYCRLRGSLFCLVHKRRKYSPSLATEAICLSNVHHESLYSVSASLISALWEAGPDAKSNIYASHGEMDFSLHMDKIWTDQTCNVLMWLPVD